MKNHNSKRQNSFFAAKAAVASFFVLAFAFFAVAFATFKSLLSARDGEEGQKILRLEIQAGTTAREISDLLFESGVIKDARAFYLLARFPKLGKVFFAKDGIGEEAFAIKAGVCEVSSSWNAGKIYKALSSGLSEQAQVSVPEGLTLSKIARRLENAGVCSAQDFLEVVRSEEFLNGEFWREAGLSEGGLSGPSENSKDAEKGGGEGGSGKSDDLKAAAKKVAAVENSRISDRSGAAEFRGPLLSAEGFLFPDTYFFSKDSDAKSCVIAMAKNFFQKTRDIQGFSSLSAEEKRRVVTLASIVEREYRAADEAPLIAGVFENRLQNGIRLGSCATVEYVITEILGRPHPDIITFADLEIKSPFNTYLNAGLPPAPICSPGLVALRAAAIPQKSDYFYFRLMDEEEGRHVFTRTNAEHEEQTRIFKTKKNAGE